MTVASNETILFIIPLPPPITGAALAAETVTGYFNNKYHNIILVNYERGNLVSGKFSFKQFFNIIISGIKIASHSRKVSLVYLVISSTLLGNLRDMFFLIMVGKRLRKNTFLHLHGSNIDKYLSSAPLWVKWLNKRLIGNVKSAIVLGATFKDIFAGYISNDKVRIVKNFVKNDMFIQQERIQSKFESFGKINILFLSNLMKEKGYEIILDSFSSLNENIRNSATLHFAGDFYSNEERNSFLKKIKNISNIIYHGPVAGKQKQTLLWSAHIFCLPTYYRFEAQPISILEAYASGCIVLTTSTGGISDMFVNNKNGFFVEIKDANSLRERLEMLIMNIDKYKHIANFNFKEAAKKYKEEIFCKNMEKIIINKHN